MKRLASKKNIAARLLGSARLMDSVAGTRRNAIRILAYHRVLTRQRVDGNCGSPFPFDDGVISATTESFRSQMDYVKRNFDVVSFRDLYAVEVNGGALPRRPMIVTFDDGYRDNYTDAFPVLKELGIPATVFVATRHVGSRSLFWWDVVAYCLKATQRREIRLGEISGDAVPLDTQDRRRAAIEQVLTWMKTVPEEIKTGFAQRLPGALGVALEPDVADGMHLSWDEIREMAHWGIEFGSHTVTHPVLSNVDDRQLDREIRDSKAALERELHTEVLVFSYPVGGLGRFDSRAMAAVARAGYRYAVSYVEGVANFADGNRYALPRIHVEADHSLNLFRANMRFPSLMLRSAARQ